MNYATKMRHKALRNAYRGAQLLDDIDAESADGTFWRDAIDLNKLDIHSEYDCVLGQLFGDYEIGVAELGIDNPERYGFNLGDVGPWLLNTAWRYILSD